MAKKNTLFDNEFADQFFPKKEKAGQFGGGFIGAHQETVRSMNKRKPRKLFPSVENFIEG